MSIEKKVHQLQFKNGYHRLTINLIYTTNLLQAFLSEIFKKEGLTLQQYNILRILRGSKPMPLSTLEIRERMMDKMSDTSRIVDRLLKKEMVTKVKSATDNRLVEVRIADRGIQLLKRLDDIEDKIASFLGNLSEAEAQQISGLLDKIHDNK